MENEQSNDQLNAALNGLNLGIIAGENDHKGLRAVVAELTHEISILKANQEYLRGLVEKPAAKKAGA